MIRRVGVFGSSGMAREVRDIAEDLGFSVVFVVRDRVEISSSAVYEDVILEADIERFTDMPYVIGIGTTIKRKEIANRFSNKVHFVNLIHPSATFGKNQRNKIEKKKGVIVSAGVRFTNEISIGDFTIFNLNSTISHDCIIDDFVTISPQSCVLGNVTIKCGAWIGAGAIINQGTPQKKIIIGEDTVIGSGAVILNSCDPKSIYAGVPARKIR